MTDNPNPAPRGGQCWEAVKPTLEDRLSEQDVLIGDMLFSGRHQTKEIADKVNLSCSQIRAISRGDYRPQVQEYIRQLRMELLTADRHLLIHGRLKALKVLIDGLDGPQAITCARSLRAELAALLDGLDDDAQGLDVSQAILLLRGKLAGQGNGNGNGKPHQDGGGNGHGDTDSDST